VRLAVAATPSLAIPTLEWILTSGHDLDLVITRPDKRSGRGKEFQESEVGQWARAHNIAIVKPERASDLADVLVDIDLVVTIAYGVILPEKILEIPTHGFINVHFSLLPSWRGAAPVQRSIENGDLVSGITVFQLDQGMDTGPIYVYDAVDIKPNETSGELLNRLAERAPGSVKSAIEMIERGEVTTPQSAELVTYASKILKEESRINWHDSSRTLARRIRAFNPNPGCWTLWKGSRISINRAHVGETKVDLRPGSISIIEDELVVGCGQSSSLVIDEVQPAGKRAMKTNEWLNGARCQAGDSFE
jgi:methionyl-tRNA formyltransferase